MKQLRFALLLCTVLVGCAATSSHSQDQAVPGAAIHQRRVAAYIGQRSLDEEFQPVEDQLVLGAEFSSETQGSSVGWEIAMFSSADSGSFLGTDVEASTWEFSGGIHKSLGDGNVRPYLGMGVSFVMLTAEASGFSEDDDTSVGLYAHGGLAFPLNEQFELGIDLRSLFGTEMQIAGIDTDADYWQLSMLLRWTF